MEVRHSTWSQHSMSPSPSTDAGRDTHNPESSATPSNDSTHEQPGSPSTLTSTEGSPREDTTPERAQASPSDDTVSSAEASSSMVGRLGALEDTVPVQRRMAQFFENRQVPGGEGARAPDNQQGPWLGYDGPMILHADSRIRMPTSAEASHMDELRSRNARAEQEANTSQRYRERWRTAEVTAHRVAANNAVRSPLGAPLGQQGIVHGGDANSYQPEHSGNDGDGGGSVPNLITGSRPFNEPNSTQPPIPASPPRPTVSLAPYAPPWAVVNATQPRTQTNSIQNLAPATPPPPAAVVLPRWQPDAEVTLCPICGTQFSMFVLCST